MGFFVGAVMKETGGKGNPKAVNEILASVCSLDKRAPLHKLRRLQRGPDSMYAVISSGGKQYRVAEGETLRVEKLAGGAGSKVTFGPLLFADDGGGVQVGQPTVKGVTVEAEIVDQGLAKKIIIFKYKRRKSYRRKQGHRQPYTALKITAIRAGAEGLSRWHTRKVRGPPATAATRSRSAGASSATPARPCWRATSWFARSAP